MTKHQASLAIYVLHKNTKLTTNQANELPGHSPQVAPANVRRSRRPAARNGNAEKRDQKRPRGARLHFFGSAWRWKNDSSANPCQGAELREGADGDALRRVRFLQGDCFRDFAGRD